ncbi:hypothetical protein THAOC_26875 [Thalassiosira oceanica]|uniref:Uncharacterized protein n=1 Tax=Thalassiosira oceanica TaxID=159749 RepID=K0RXS9_THAOC|nr:hypothetical protein THAOC_26875 [Thalassiosira oceanica]|eukprot:EJK53641.1 hypothetical protein THAOC_26875 [Thalassiosira oceanica]
MFDVSQSVFPAHLRSGKRSLQAAGKGHSRTYHSLTMLHHRASGRAEVGTTFLFLEVTRVSGRALLRHITAGAGDPVYADTTLA